MDDIMLTLRDASRVFTLRRRLLDQGRTTAPSCSLLRMKRATIAAARIYAIEQIAHRVAMPEEDQADSVRP